MILKKNRSRHRNNWLNMQHNLSRLAASVSAWGLMSIFLFQIMAKDLILINYYVHKEHYAKELCVKRHIKGNCCQGKCQVKKQLHNADEQEKKNNLPSNEKYEIVFIIQHKTTDLKPLGLLRIISTPYSKRAVLMPPQGIFHPPLSIMSPFQGSQGCKICS